MVALRWDRQLGTVIVARAIADHDSDLAAACVVGVGLAAVAAIFPIKGMVQLFSGAPTLTVAIAISMESAKLVTAGWLARTLAIDCVSRAPRPYDIPARAGEH